MELRPDDQEALEQLGRPADVVVDGGFVTLVIHEYPLPAGIEPRSTTLLLRLPPGFPDAAPDMFWVDPPVRGPGGAAIPGTESSQTFLDRTWQRWSRHIQGQWRPGVDNLATYLAYVRRCFDQASGRAA